MSALIALLALAAAPQAAPSFDPLVFFAGSTRGEGRLKIALHPARPVTVRGQGERLADGTFVLTQQVTEGDKPPRTRTWRLRRVGPDRYAGTLSDAAGPVSGETHGNRLHLAYKGKGVAIAQWLTLAPDGQSAQNRLTARKLGVVVAVLNETIRRTGAR